MANVIRDRTIIADSWRLLDAEAWLRVGESGLVADLPRHGDLLAPLRLWQARRDDLLDHPGRVGLLLEAWDEPEPFARDLPSLALIAVRVAQHTDGRAYSLARLLRGRYGYRGELRATGDVLRDQLFYLARCGFDAFALREDQEPQAALTAFDDFSEAYQASVERLQPLFRRRLAA